MTTTRQAGEAVAWRFKLTSSDEWEPCTLDPRCDTTDLKAVEPLIPASDLEQVSRERDEAVRHLRAMSHVCPKPGEVEAAIAFLNTIGDRDGGEPG